MAERVDAAVQGVKASSVESPLDGTGRQACVEQLAACDHPMLAGGKRRDRPFTLREVLSLVPFPTCLQSTTHMVV